MTRSGLFCCLVETDFYRDDLLIAMNDGRAAMVSIDGEVLGPHLPEPVEQSTKVALLPDDDVVVLGQFGRGSVTAYEWRTGRRLWRRERIRELYEIICFASRRLLIVQISGRCTEVDALTGEEFATLGRVVGAHADSRDNRVILERGVRRVASYTTEYRTELGQAPLFASTHGGDSYVFAAFGDGWMAVTEHSTGDITGLDTRGNILWTRVAPEDTRIRCLTPIGREARLFALQRSTYPKEDGDVGLVLNPLTGEVLQSRPIPGQHLAFEPMCGGRVLVGVNGILRVPSLEFEAREFRI